MNHDIERTAPASAQQPKSWARPALLPIVTCCGRTWFRDTGGKQASP